MNHSTVISSKAVGNKMTNCASGRDKGDGIGILTLPETQLSGNPESLDQSSGFILSENDTSRLFMESMCSSVPLKENERKSYMSPTARIIEKMKQDMEKKDLNPKTVAEIDNSIPKTPPRSSPRKGNLKTLASVVKSSDSDYSPCRHQQILENTADVLKKDDKQLNPGVLTGKEEKSNESGPGQTPKSALGIKASRPTKISGPSLGVRRSTRTLSLPKGDLNTKERDDNKTLVSEWTLVLGSNGICVDGQRSQDLPGNNWTSSIVVERISADEVSTIRGSVYKLIGPFQKKHAIAAGVQATLAKQFMKGFPENWKDLVNKYYPNFYRIKEQIPDTLGTVREKKKTKATSKMCPATHQAIRGSSIKTPTHGNGTKEEPVDLTDFPMTRSGRRILPPLAFWANQRKVYYRGYDIVGVIQGGSNGLSTSTPILDFKEDKNISLLTKRSSSAKITKTQSRVGKKKTPQLISVPENNKLNGRLSSKQARCKTQEETGVPSSIEKVGNSDKLPILRKKVSKEIGLGSNSVGATDVQLKTKDTIESRQTKSSRQSLRIRSVSNSPVRTKDVAINSSTDDPAASEIEKSIMKIVSESKNKRLKELQLRKGVRPTVYNRSPHIELKDIRFTDENNTKALLQKAVKSGSSQSKKIHQGVLSEKNNKHKQARTFPRYIDSTDGGSESSESDTSIEPFVKQAKNSGVKKNILPKENSASATPTTSNGKQSSKRPRSQTANSQPRKRSQSAQSTKQHSSNVPANTDEWTSDEISRFDEAIRNLVPSSSKVFWKLVSQKVKTKNIEECRKFQQKKDLSAEKTTTQPAPKKADVQPIVKEPVQITGGVGTMKRKRQLRAFVNQHDQSYKEDCFEETPAKKLKLKQIGANVSNEDDFFGNLKTPGMLPTKTPTQRSSWMPKSATKTPVSYLINPEYFGSAKRNDADIYLYKVKQRCQKTRKILPPTSAQKSQNSAITNLKPDMPTPTDLFDIKEVSDPDSSNEDDYYFSD